MVALAIAVVIAGALPQVMFGALGASIIRDTGISNSQLGMIFAIFSCVSMLVARLGGSLSERWGWRNAARIACGLSAGSFAGIAVLGRGLWTLALFMGIGGLAQSVAAPSSNLLMAREVRSRGGTAMGLKQSAVPTASIIAGASVPVFALTVGWRWAFAATAVLVLAVPFFVGNAPELSPRQVPELPEGDGATTPADSAPRDACRSLERLRPTLVGMAFAGFLGTFTAHAYNAFFVVSSVEQGVDEVLAATLFAISGVACLVVRVLSGVISDRRPGIAQRPLTSAGLMLGVGVIGMALLATGIPSVIVAASLITYAAGWGWPALYHMSIVRYFADEPAKATGSLRIGLSGGAMTGPLAYGLLSSATSFTFGWAMVALVGAAGAVALIHSERNVRGRMRVTAA